jgi:dienelactone hydrolase
MLQSHVGSARPRVSRELRRRLAGAAALAGLAALSLLCGCARYDASAIGTVTPVREAVEPATFLAQGEAREIEPGVLFQAVASRRVSGVSRLWIYRPKRASGHKRPCVLVAPAGTRLFHGMTLSEGDRAEHLPYARAGFVVVAYEIDGALPDLPTQPEVIRAARSFQAADAGLVNAREALDYALRKLPEVDSRRIYTAGHSSAATLSLVVAEHEPRVRACIAYAPNCDLESRLGDPLIRSLSGYLPGYRDFIRHRSPQREAGRLGCPVFLFCADDDTTVPPLESICFAAQLRRTNPRVTLVRVPTGNHYPSMIRQGIPRAISWLQSLPAVEGSRRVCPAAQRMRSGTL